ncbi:MAG: isopentenyl phosphate kinase [Candidatus Thorarchaeota archaeon]
MKKITEIILLKLGGSLLTDKDKPKSIRKNIVESAVQQIIDANKKIVLIHGGGSFGHPLAKEFSISTGINLNIPKQILGLTKTHQSMNSFNSYLIDKFLEYEFPVLSIQASSIFIKDTQGISMSSIDIIETSLDLNIMPILYGDIILDKSGSFSIISGDQIILELCRNLRRYCISKVIFTMEADGIYITDFQNSQNYALLPECYADDLDNLNLADLGQKIDVTGGIKGKLDFIKKICHQNIPVQIINGLKEGYIYKSLKNQKLDCTHILIKR